MCGDVKKSLAGKVVEVEVEGRLAKRWMDG